MNMNSKLFRSIIILAIILASCSRQNEKIIGENLGILPNSFTPKDLSLSEIATDIKIIPLSNDIPIPSVRFIIWNDSIFYIAYKAQGKIYRFAQDGNYIDMLDKQGRGEGEYQYIVDFFIDKSTGYIYVSTNINKIVVYDNNFNHLRDIKYPQKRDGGLRAKWLDNYIHIFYFNYTGQGYNWFKIDTLGNVLDSSPCVDTYKLPAPTFAIQLFHNNNKLYRYFDYNDTIYEIDNDGYRPYILVNRMFSDGYNDVYIEGESPYNPNSNISRRRIRSIFGIGDYWLINYQKIKNTVNYRLEETVLYDYNANVSYIVNSFEPVRGSPFSIGLFNDWVGSGSIYPRDILEINGSKYILHSTDAIKFLDFVNSEEFEKGTPQRQEIKQKMKEIADTLTIDDNPVLILLELR